MIVSQINFAIVLRTTLDKFCSLLAANQIKENLVVVQLVATQVKCGVDWRGFKPWSSRHGVAGDYLPSSLYYKS